MSSLGRIFWGLLQNFFSWLARLFYEKERRPDCEEQIGLPTRAVHGKKMPSDVTSSTSNRQGTHARPPRHSDWTRQNVFRQPSSKRRAVHDDRPHRKRRPALGPPLVQFDTIPQRSKLFSHGTYATPAIRIEDWSILPPSRKFLSQRLSFITAPTRVLRLSGFIFDSRQDLLAVPATDSLGHLYSPSSSHTGRYKHVGQKESEQTDVSISKLALPSKPYGCPTNERRNLDSIQAKANDNKFRHSHSVGELFTRKLHVTARNTMPVLKRFSRRHHFDSLPATGFSSLSCKDGIAEQDLRATNKKDQVDEESKVIPDNPAAEVDPSVYIDSTSSVLAHGEAGPPTTTARLSRDSQSFFGLDAPAKLPYADFGDVPYPFVFDLDFYLSEADVPATPILLVSFPGLGSEFSSPATDYFDTPTPSPKLPVAPLLIQQTSLSDTACTTDEIPDSSRSSGDLVPERSIQESLDTAGRTLSLHSSGIEDISSSQSEYSIISASCINDSLTSSDFGKPSGDDLDKPIFNKLDGTSHGGNTSTVIEKLPSESRKAGEDGGVFLPEKVIVNVYSTEDEDRAGMMNQTPASAKYASSSSTHKSCETSNEGESEGHKKAQDSLTIDESTFFNRHRRLLEDLSFCVSNGKRHRSSKQDGLDRSTLLEQSNVASFIAYPTVPEVGSNNIAYSQSPRVLDNVCIAAGSYFHSALREGLVTGQRKMHHRATVPVKPLTPMLIPTVGVGVGEKMMRRGIKGSKGGFEQERPRLRLVGRKLGGVGPHRVADLPQVARGKVIPEKF